MTRSTLNQSRSPLYLQIAEALRQRIIKGTWEEGMMVPTLDQLTSEFGVAKVTVRQAVRILGDEGLIEARRGKGTTVLPLAAQGRPLKLGSQLSDLLKTYQGDEFDILELGETPVPLPAKYTDGIPFDEYRVMRRLHSRDGQNYCVVTIYLPEHIYVRQADLFQNDLVLPTLLNDQNVKIHSGKQAMVISKSDIETANILNIAIGDPTADICRTLFDDENRIIYLADLVHRGDYIQLDVDLTI